MSRNHWNMNQAIASSHVFAEQCKGLLLAYAKVLLVVVSGLLMFLGFLLTFTGVRFVWSIQTLQAIGAAAPVAVVGFLFAVCIEAGTLLSAGVVIEASRMRKIDLERFDRVKHSYPTDTMREVKRKEITRRGRGSVVIMYVCIGFSVLGAELFWQQAFVGQSLAFHLLGIPLGLVCSVLLLFFEFNEPTVQQRIETVISSTALIQLALNESAKARIFDRLFEEQRTLLQDGEGFNGIIREAAKQHLIGAAQEAIQMVGVTTTAEQLQMSVQDELTAIAAADAELSGKADTTNVLPMQQRISLQAGGRNTLQRKKVTNAIKKYGASRLLADPDKYAQELGVSTKTIRRWASSQSRP